MFILPIDEKSCIIQAYFDGGDSYVGHNKYNVVDKYKANPEGTVYQAWDAMRVAISEKGRTVIERDGLDLDISKYDRFRLFAMAPDCVRVKLFCNDELVIDKSFGGKIENIDSDAKSKISKLKSIRFEFENSNENPVTVILHYLGMVCDDKSESNCFNDDWEGFFEENPDYGLFNENVVSRDELEKIREKVKREPLKTSYEQIKKAALEVMKREPEKQIKRTVADYFRKENNISGIVKLAVVGQIDQNPEMLKMACRGALSLASCEYWCCDPMETAPTITWHHRSFTESSVSFQISFVLSLAGGLLTWHGRNFLYNALVMKGLPRMEADFMTMEYIYHMNQGIAFMGGYIPTLLTLSERFPRYEARIKEAEAILDEMLGNAFDEDGSTHEGAGYWHYTILAYFYSAYFLARAKKKSLKEYINGRLDKTAEFGCSLVDEKANELVFNDCHANAKYSSVVSAFMFLITEDERWAKINSMNPLTDSAAALMITAAIDIPETDIALVSEFKELASVGYTQVYRAGIHFVISAGPSNYTHSHRDKGSFIIYKNGEMVVPDPAGVYDKATTVLYDKTSCHSLAAPITDGVETEQFKGDEYISKVIKSSYENGVFEWQCDNSGMWDSEAVIKSARYVYSDKADEFIITDEFEFSKPSRLLFRVNAMNPDAIEVEPLNWKPAEEKTTELCAYAGGIVHQICKISDEQTSFFIKTKIKVLRGE